MSIYHWLVVLILALAVVLRGARKGNTAYILLVFVLLFCIQGLRDSQTIGNDSRTSYRYDFNAMADREWSDLGDIRDWAHFSGEDESYAGQNRNFATRWLMKLVYDLTNGDYQWFIAIVAAIILSSEALIIHKYSPSPIQSVLYYLGLLFFIFQMSATKQSIAMAILFLAFPSIVDRKPVRFILLVVAASFFHFPALVFLPAYWIANMRTGRHYLILLAGLFLLTYLLRDRILNLMNDAYYDSEVDAVGDVRFLANKVIVMLIIIVAALLIRPPDPDDRVYCALLHLMGMAAVIQTFSSYSNIFERLADYYFQFAVIFIPMVFERIKPRRRYLSEQTSSLVYNYAPYIFCAFAVWRFLDTILNDEHFTPFRFFFQ